MTAGHTITIAPADLHVTVTVDGTTIAQTDRPVLLDETGLPTRYYLRREDVSVELRPTSFATHCPFKGDASYWTVALGDQVHDGVAWSYEAPIAGAEEITGLVCFFPERTEITVTPAA